MDGTSERFRRLEIDEAEVRMRLEGTVESLRRDHDMEPARAEQAGLPPLPPGVGAPARARELERELRLMGPINPLALEEFNDCLLYTSDAADERSSVDLGGRRIIKKKKRYKLERWRAPTTTIETNETRRDHSNAKKATATQAEEVIHAAIKHQNDNE